MRLQWTKPMPDDESRHRWTKFGREKAFSGLVYFHAGRWHAKIALRLWCVIEKRGHGRPDFSTEAAAKSWVRACAETLGLLRDA